MQNKKAKKYMLELERYIAKRQYELQKKWFSRRTKMEFLEICKLYCQAARKNLELVEEQEEADK